MNRGSTFFLRAVIFLMGLGVLALCIFGLPGMGRGMANEFPAVPYLEYWVVIGYASAVPFFLALYQALKLLSYIDKNTAFSNASVRALGIIKYCGIAISICWFAFMPFAFGIAEADDAPGAVPIFALIACVPLVVTVFAGVLQKLLKNAIAIKSENDLTV